MDTLIVDPRVSERLIRERRAHGADQYDEVWGGVYVMSPAPNDEHQELATRLARPLLEIVEDPGLGVVRIGINLASDPNDWERDYRVPDVAVFLTDSPAVCHGTFWSGPPDFLVEITSPWDKTRDKLRFYSDQWTRELLLVDRDPWQLELYRLQHGQLVLVAKMLLGDATLLESEVLPLRFRLSPGTPRPTIEIFSMDLQRSWIV
jgi:Uma2 family endonuclease